MDEIAAIADEYFSVFQTKQNCGQYSRWIGESLVRKGTGFLPETPPPTHTKTDLKIYLKSRLIIDIAGTTNKKKKKQACTYRKFFPLRNM